MANTFDLDKLSVVILTPSPIDISAGLTVDGDHQIFQNRRIQIEAWGFGGDPELLHEGIDDHDKSGVSVSRVTHTHSLWDVLVRWC